jgi:hypothetical protein
MTHLDSQDWRREVQELGEQETNTEIAVTQKALDTLSSVLIGLSVVSTLGRQAGKSGTYVSYCSREDRVRERGTYINIYR